MLREVGDAADRALGVGAGVFVEQVVDRGEDAAGLVHRLIEEAGLGDHRAGAVNRQQGARGLLGRGEGERGIAEHPAGGEARLDIGG